MKYGLLCALALTNCTDQISADLPAPPNRLVLNTIADPDSVLRVQVSRVTSAADSSSRLLRTAQVTLEADGQAPEILRNDGKGFYSSASLLYGTRRFTVRATVPGYPSVSATDTIPPLVQMHERMVLISHWA